MIICGENMEECLKKAVEIYIALKGYTHGARRNWQPVGNFIANAVASNNQATDTDGEAALAHYFQVRTNPKLGLLSVN